MISYRDLLLRLTIWFLLTSDLSRANIVMGVIVSLLLPKFGYPSSAVLKDWLKALWEIIVAIPRAYAEAFELIRHPHLHEEITLERSKPGRSPGLIFLDIFLITFTPKTMVVKYHDEGWHEIHSLKRNRRL